MKRYITVTLGIFLLTAWVWGNQWQQAEDLYRQGRFASALGVYEKLVSTYPNDPNLYYNIGNCYFKMGSKGLATANYYRAFQLAPRDTEIRHNLALSLQNSGERLVPAGMPEVLHKLFFSLTGTELTGLLFLMGWVTCLLGGFWILKRRWGKTLFALLVIILAIGSVPFRRFRK